MTSRNVPYVDLAGLHKRLLPELHEAVDHVLCSADFILGEAVANFESEIARRCGVRHAIGVNSGTDALVLAMRALGIGPDDEVITVANTFVATASAVRLLGAMPVFVDVGDDYNMDPDLLPAALTPNTRAVLPVHLTGRPADMERIMDFARSHELPVVEDCAQAIGARLDGRSVGSFGRVGCFSLHPLKNLGGCGDGGFVTTDDDELAAEVRILRNIGLESRDRCVRWSGNSRLDSIHAAIHLAKLPHLEEWTAARRRNAAFYEEHLPHCITFPTDTPDRFSVYHTFGVQADRRDELKAFLAEHGIGTAIHYPIPIHLQPCAADLPGSSLPVTESQAKRILSLPVYPGLTQEDLQYVVDHVSLFSQRS